MEKKVVRRRADTAAYWEFTRTRLRGKLFRPNNDERNEKFPRYFRRVSERTETVELGRFRCVTASSRPERKSAPSVPDRCASSVRTLAVAVLEYRRATSKMARSEGERWPRCRIQQACRKMAERKKTRRRFPSATCIATRGLYSGTVSVRWMFSFSFFCNFLLRLQKVGLLSAHRQFVAAGSRQRVRVFST